MTYLADRDIWFNFLLDFAVIELPIIMSWLIRIISVVFFHSRVPVTVGLLFTSAGVGAWFIFAEYYNHYLNTHYQFPLRYGYSAVFGGLLALPIGYRIIRVGPGWRGK